MPHRLGAGRLVPHGQHRGAVLGLPLDSNARELAAEALGRLAQRRQRGGGDLVIERGGETGISTRQHTKTSFNLKDTPSKGQPKKLGLHH